MNNATRTYARSRGTPAGRNNYSGIDDDALRVIRGKAARFAGRGAFAGLDRDDLEQELVLDLLARLPKYDPGRGAVSTFAARVADHRLATLVKALQAEKRDWRRNGASLQDGIDDGDGGQHERCQTLSGDADRRRTGASDADAEDSRDLCLDVRAALAALPPDLREACAWLLHYSVTEVSRATRVPRATLQHRLKKVLVRFRKAGLEAYCKSRRRISADGGK